ncbi:MAG: hypothetical protein RBU37_04905 [Myxococcota bacterium]|jgi:CheY-like chemotaxis protein|nr:hypothetical protein [Myxococcota bacterium]
MSSIPSILLLAPERRDQRLLAKALAATGCSVRVAGDITEARNLVQQAGADLVVADYDPPHAADPRALAEYDSFLTECAAKPASHWVNGKTRVLLLADKRQKSELQSLFRLQFMSNLVAKSHPLDLDELIITVGKIVRNDIFGIEKYLCYGVQPITYEVRSSRDKVHLLDALSNYATGLDINRRLLAVAQGVADELIMNAVYNAPVRADGSRIYAQRQRTEAVDLSPAEFCYFTYACDGRQLVIAMRDRFGSLAAETVREYLHRCFAMGADQIEAKDGGAGIGLYFIVESLNKIIINISPGRGTEIIGLLDVSGSYRDYAEKNKSFHIFVS